MSNVLGVIVILIASIAFVMVFFAVLEWISSLSTTLGETTSMLLAGAWIVSAIVACIVIKVVCEEKDKK
jgi:hypothetical protein